MARKNKGGSVSRDWQAYVVSAMQQAELVRKAEEKRLEPYHRAWDEKLRGLKADNIIVDEYWDIEHIDCQSGDVIMAGTPPPGEKTPIWDLNKMASELWKDTHDTSKNATEPQKFYYSQPFMPENMCNAFFGIDPETYELWKSVKPSAKLATVNYLLDECSISKEEARKLLELPVEGEKKAQEEQVSRAVTCSICDSEDFDALFRPSDLVPDVTVRSNYYVCTDCFIGKFLPMMDTFVKDLSKASSFAYGASTAVPEEDTQPGGTMARRTCWGCYKGLCKVHRQT